MKFQENYKIALASYKFGGSVLERMLNNGVTTLELEDINVLQRKTNVVYAIDSP